MEFQETNRVDGSPIQPLVAELCRVESRMKMSFMDTWSLSVRDDSVIVGHGKSMIKRLKKELGSQFVMKSLGPTRKIWGMLIIHDIRNKKLSYYSGVILHSEKVQL